MYTLEILYALESGGVQLPHSGYRIMPLNVTDCEGRLAEEALPRFYGSHPAMLCLGPKKRLVGGGAEGAGDAGVTMACDVWIC